jgi:hypothetical protein
VCKNFLHNGAQPTRGNAARRDEHFSAGKKWIIGNQIAPIFARRILCPPFAPSKPAFWP